MTDNKTIGISSIIALGIVLSSMLIPGFFEESKYYCESRPEIGIVHCDSFSKYVDPNGKCIRDDNTNLICRTGWIEVTNDINNSNDIIPEVVTGQKFLCPPNDKCVAID